jgi:protoheme IX farnesyltransferase
MPPEGVIRMRAATHSISAFPAAAAPSRMRDFYELTKPRMNFLVVITTMVGCYMACIGSMKWLLLVNTLLGTALTAASSAVLNQFVERGYDALMRRTQDRPIPAGRISLLESLLFGASLGIAGLLYLAVFVNLLTAFLGAITLLVYLFLYTPMKRWSTLCTVIGAIPGAIPPVMGFTAFQNALSPAAIAVFGILFIWQMPHFLAIAILYKEDYARGGFRMLPVVDDELYVTARQIVVYSLALIPATLLPAALHIAGVAYFTAAILLGLAFVSFAISTATTRTRTDARKLFFASFIYLPLLLGVMVLDKI